MRSAPNAARNAARFVGRALRTTAATLLVLCGIAAVGCAMLAVCYVAATPDYAIGLSFAAVGIVVTAKDLREQAAKFVDRCRKMVNRAEKEDREFTEDEQKRYDSYRNRANKLLNRAKRVEEIDGFENAGGDEEEEPPAGGRGGRARNAGRTPAGGLGQLPHNPRITVRENADPGMRGFRHQRDFLDTVVNAYQGGQLDDRLRPLMVSNAAGADEHSTQSDPYLGFFVPEGMLPGWLRTEPEPDPMLGRLTNVPMGSPRVKVNARVDKNHSTSVSGGLTVSRRIETQSGDSSRMQAEQIELKADSLYGLSYASEELLADSPQTIAALLSMGFRDEFQSHLIQERLSGTGVGEFLGILNSPALISVAKESGQAADTINGTNILKMRARCWRYGQSVWLYNHDCYEQLAKVHIAGTNGDQFLFNPARGIDTPDTLLGRPAFPTEYAKTLGDQGDLILAVWGEFLEGTYQPLQGAESIHVRFLENERAFRFTMRNAGAPWWRSVLTPKESSTTLSPFVVLDERA